MQATARALGWDRSTVTQRLKGLCFQALVDSSGDQARPPRPLAGDPSLLRTVELKLMDYTAHLMETIAPFADVDEALLDCKRRFKNLPERHLQVRRNARAAAFQSRRKSPAGSAVRPAQEPHAINTQPSAVTDNRNICRSLAT